MKICFATYIHGDNYQDFIPWILYTVGKAYPEYYTIIFINGEIRRDLVPQINLVNSVNNNYKIIQHYFDDCKHMNPIKAQSIRWVIWDDMFNDFDYIYYIDSDMFFIREPIPMHEQHIRHMKYIKSNCISNILRRKKLGISYSNRYITWLNYKYGGIGTVVRQAVTPYVFRVSGLHFVKVPEYFGYVNAAVREKYKQVIFDGSGLKRLAFYNDEHLLYKMLEDSGCDLSVLGIQQSSVSMFGMNNPERKEFCPHHGIHMGIFRTELDALKDWAIAQLESEDYKYYIDQFHKYYVSDSLFNELLNSSPDRIKERFYRMYKYYDIEFNNIKK